MTLRNSRSVSVRLLFVSLLALLFISIIFQPLLHAAGTESEKNFEAQTTGLKSVSPLADLFQDWKVLSVLAIMVSIILVAMAYMVGNGFDLADMKAWASSELTQVFVNALIIVVLIGSIALLDNVAQETVKQSGLTIPCTGGQSCLGAIAVSYLNSYLDVAKADARNVVTKSMDAADSANTHYGIYCISIICGQVGTSLTTSGHLILEQDRYNSVFEYYTNLLSSLEAQKFFVQSISFKLGPMLLAMGLVGRSFFVTRKAGGLLVAIAIGIMFFLPGMYIFDWVTLDTTLTGDKSLDKPDTLCPAECKMPYPIAFTDNGNIKFASLKEVASAFTSDQLNTAQGIASGSIKSATASTGKYEGQSISGKTITSCMQVSDKLCPLFCRELPYPSSNQNCSKSGVEQACSSLPKECWLKRITSTTSSSTSSLLFTCPNECKVVPPLNPNCGAACFSSRSECRVFGRTDDPNKFEWKLDPPKGTSDLNSQAAACAAAETSCTPNLDANKSCSYVLPQTGTCDQLCDGCPEICRVITGDPTKLPDVCMNQTLLGLDPPVRQLSTMCAATSCPVGCRVNATHIAEVSKNSAPSALCGSCAPEKRIVTYGALLPDSYTSGGCSFDNCPADLRVPVPRNSCEQCIFGEASEMYLPPLQTSCSELCKPNNQQIPTMNAGDFTKVGSEGLVGKPEIQNVAKLILPAYILPLINVVATLVFIRGLSVILGGDVEIPGMSKVF